MTEKIKQLTPLDEEERDGCVRLISSSGEANTIEVPTGKMSLGSNNPKFIKGFVEQLANIASQGPEVDADGLAYAVSIVTGAQPRDELESMLVAQMAAIHNATMRFSRRLSHVENISQQDSAERALNKLARTYALQLQALQKYRSGGKQSMVVRHVHVNDGGQAIVGNVQGGGGVN